MKTAMVSISPFPEDHLLLRALLERDNWKIYAAQTFAEALAPLSGQEVSVVVCERDLPDGDWKDILTNAAMAASAPCLIVTSRLADDCLWAEVLNLGGYDVLAKPFHSEEVIRVLDLAHRHWNCERERERAQSIPGRRTGDAAAS